MSGPTYIEGGGVRDFHTNKLLPPSQIEYPPVEIPPIQSSITFIWRQDIASGIWHIQHNLGAFPSVTIVDSAGTQIIGDVQYIDSNNITVSFDAGSFAGIAYLNY